MDCVGRRADLDLAVLLASSRAEQRCAPTEQHRSEMQAQLVYEALLDRLPDDVPAAHDDDMTALLRGPASLLNRRRKIGTRAPKAISSGAGHARVGSG